MSETRSWNRGRDLVRIDQSTLQLCRTSLNIPFQKAIRRANLKNQLAKELIESTIKQNLSLTMQNMAIWERVSCTSILIIKCQELALTHHETMQLWLNRTRPRSHKLKSKTYSRVPQPPAKESVQVPITLTAMWAPRVLRSKAVLSGDRINSWRTKASRPLQTITTLTKNLLGREIRVSASDGQALRIEESSFHRVSSAFHLFYSAEPWQEPGQAAINIKMISSEQDTQAALSHEQRGIFTRNLSVQAQLITQLNQLWGERLKSFSTSPNLLKEMRDWKFQDQVHMTTLLRRIARNIKA